MKKKKTPKSKFFNVDSLVEQAENTRFVLLETNKPRQQLLADKFDDYAKDLWEQFHESGLDDLYESNMRDLKMERLKCMTNIGKRIELGYARLAELTEVRERIKALTEIVDLLKEYGALLYQCDRLPWARL